MPFTETSHKFGNIGIISMGKRGPKRKEGVREANGRLDRRSTVERLNAMNAADSRRIKEVVLSQPHRRGSEDSWLSSALGRFCRQAGCKEGVYDGVQEYAVAKERWSIAVGKPRGYENLPPGGCGIGPTDEQVRRWREKFMKVHVAIVEEFGTFIMSQVHRLAVEDLDLREDTLAQNTPAIRSALGQVAVITGGLEANPHPFRK